MFAPRTRTTITEGPFAAEKASMSQPRPSYLSLLSVLPPALPCTGEWAPTDGDMRLAVAFFDNDEQVWPQTNTKALVPPFVGTKK